MKNLDYIIEKDTKWLLHFLKEKHIFKPYFEKMISQNKQNMSLKYDDWLNHIKNNPQYYKPSYLGDISLNDYIFSNAQLFDNIILFSNWHNLPFTLDINTNSELYKWSEISHEYKKFKRNLKIINYENY